MEGLLVVIAPVLLILFALSMERIEGHLRRLTVQRQDVQDFIETHAPVDILTDPAVGLMSVSAPLPRPANAGSAAH
ncbi:hypothetical protein [Tomitella biformata]|uniref:hypothetical protein n=1 Tax=Tomitella biformata TaxID=630403 RepID=UPI00046698F2|nr:hypothetical protein [Tomitella biformata]